LLLFFSKKKAFLHKGHIVREGAVATINKGVQNGFLAAPSQLENGSVMLGRTTVESRANISPLLSRSRPQLGFSPTAVDSKA
jgi:hypothetical protein